MPRRGILRRRRRRNAPTERMKEAAQRAREEAAAVVTRRNEERAPRAGGGGRSARLEAVTVRLRGAALEARRRLRPVGASVQGGAARIAPFVSRGLFVVLRIPVALVATLLDLFLDFSRWLRSRLGPLAVGISAMIAVLAERVTPPRAVAAVAALAAVALGASQFVDYRGVALSVPEYRGEVGTAAPVPVTDLEQTGSAHHYALLPLAVLALALVWLTLGGRWRLGRAIGLIGLIGIAVAILIDAPEGLEAGTAGIAYTGTEARLLEGFWAQVAACATLLLCGPLLGLYVRTAAGEPGRERGRRRRSERQSRRERRSSAKRRRVSTSRSLGAET